MAACAANAPLELAAKTTWRSTRHGRIWWTEQDVEKLASSLKEVIQLAQLETNWEIQLKVDAW